MDLTTFLYIFGASLVPVTGWAVRLHINISNMNRKLDKLVEMLVESNSATSAFKSEMQENTRALVALTHYIKYLEVQRTGREPPPPLEL